MTFSWPWALLSLLIIPLIFAIRAWARRRRRAAVRVTSIALVRTALPGRTRWTRKIPAADQLERALDSLPGTFTVIQQRVDTAAAFAAGSAVLIATALSLSLWWNRPRPPTR